MKKLFFTIVLLLMSLITIGQENTQLYGVTKISTGVSIRGERIHTIKVEDSLAKDVIFEIFSVLVESKCDYEKKLFTLQEIRIESMPKNTTGYETEGVISINNRLYQYPHIFRKVLFFMIAQHYNVKTYNNKRYNVLSEQIVWSSRAEKIWTHRRIYKIDLKKLISELENKYPLKSKQRR